jgi:hypothetical protein
LPVLIRQPEIRDTVAHLGAEPRDIDLVRREPSGA